MTSERLRNTSYFFVVVTILIGLSLCEPRDSWARDFTYGHGVITVPVSYKGDNVFRFSQEVKHVTDATRFDIHPLNEEQPDFSELRVVPRMNEGAQTVTFILADGTFVKMNLTIKARAFPDGDNIYDFKPKGDTPDGNIIKAGSQGPVPITEVDLMRGMVLGTNVSGFEVENYTIPIALESPDLKATVVKIYRGQDMNGYVYLLKNDSRTKYYEINIKSLSVGKPNLAIAAQVDRAVLGGESDRERQTYLRIVAKPGASSKKVILPFAIKEEKAK